MFFAFMAGWIVAKNDNPETLGISIGISVFCIFCSFMAGLVSRINTKTHEK